MEQGAGGAAQNRTFCLYLTDKVPWASGEESGGYSRGFIARVDNISGDLFFQKSVVGLVVIKSIDDIVAVSPCCRTAFVPLESVSIGVVSDVEPMAGIAFAIVGRGEHLIYQF